MAKRPPARPQARQQKSYNQQCPLAYALDRIGDRWTMLIVRELLGGPAKFGDLARALPGAASNLLTDRLRRLVDQGVVARTGPAAAPLYRLTPMGEGLRPALEALGLWGAVAGPVPDGRPAPVTSARSVAMGLRTMLAIGDRPDRPWRVELVVGEELLDVLLEPSSEPVVVCRPSAAADAQAAADLQDLNDLAFMSELPDGMVTHLSGRPEASEALRSAMTSALARKAESGPESAAAD